MERAYHKVTNHLTTLTGLQIEFDVIVFLIQFQNRVYDNVKKLLFEYISILLKS